MRAMGFGAMASRRRRRRGRLSTIAREPPPAAQSRTRPTSRPLALPPSFHTGRPDVQPSLLRRDEPSCQAASLLPPTAAARPPLAALSYRIRQPPHNVDLRKHRSSGARPGACLPSATHRSRPAVLAPALGHPDVRSVARRQACRAQGQADSPQRPGKQGDDPPVRRLTYPRKVWQPTDFERAARTDGVRAG